MNSIFLGHFAGLLGQPIAPKTNTRYRAKRRIKLYLSLQQKAFLPSYFSHFTMARVSASLLGLLVAIFAIVSAQTTDCNPSFNVTAGPDCIENCNKVHHFFSENE